MSLWASGTRRTKGNLGARWRKLTVPQGISSPAARQASRRSPRTAATRETLRRPRRRRHPRQRRGASRPAVADLDAVVARLPGVRPQPGRGVRPEPRGHVLALSPPRPERGVVGLDRVSIGPGVMFLSALGEPVHFPATDVIRRPLGDPCGRALRRLLFERGEMRLARHELSYGRHSPRHPVMGPVTLPCGRRLAPGEALAAERTTGPHKADTRPEAALGPPLLGRIQTAPRGFVWVAASAKTLG